MNLGPTRWPNVERQLQAEVPMPANLLAQPYAGHPRGKQPTCEAEEILATAVGWWDCSSGFKSGDRWLRNRGTGGEALDLRLGSSTTPNTNDPLFLEPDESGYVYTPGISNNCIQIAPSSATTAQTFSITARMEMDVAGGCIFSQTSNATNGIYINLSQFSACSVYWANGSNVGKVAQFTPPTTGRKWIRFTIDASGVDTVVMLQTAADSNIEPSSWDATAIVTVAGTTGITLVPSQRPTIGALSYTLTDYLFTGKFFRVLLRYDATTIDIDCDRIKDGATESFPAITGQTVQIVRSSSGRKSVAMPAKRYGSRACMLFGTDDYLQSVSSSRPSNISGPVNETTGQLMSYDKNTSFTWVFVGRLFGVPNFNVMDMREDPASVNYMTISAGSTWYGYLKAGSLWAQPQKVLPPQGHVQVVTLHVDRSTRTAWVSVNGDRGVSVDMAGANIAYINGYIPFRIGSWASQPDYEFTNAAAFRRVLSQREVQLLTDYYTKPSVNAYPVQAPDAERKSYLAAKLAIDPAHPVLDVMKDAVFAIDAKAYDGASNYVENLGWGGELLNPRMGSSAAADTNDPKWLAPEASGYAYLPGIAANFLTVPDAATLDITGDLDMMARVSCDSVVSGGYGLISKTDVSTNRSWEWRTGNGTNVGMLLELSANGSTTTQALAGVNIPYADGATFWARVTWRASDGRVQFFTAADSVTVPASWTQLGTDQTIAVASIYSGSGVVNIGARLSGTSLMAGRMYRAIVKNGIAGTTVLDVDCNAVTDGRQTSFLAVTGQLVTVNRSTAGRKTVLMPNTTVKVMDEANVYLPDTVGNYLSVPANASWAITDADIRVRVAFDSTAGEHLSGCSRWEFDYVGGNFLAYFNGNGGAHNTAVPYPLGTPFWARATMQYDNGANQSVITFFTAPDSNTPPTSWTQLGLPLTFAKPAQLANSGPATVGQRSGGTAYPLSGRVYRNIVYSDLTATNKILDIDTSLAVAGQSTFTAVTGQTVTINSTANSGLRVNAQKVGAGHATWLFGTDDYMEVQGALQHELLDFKGGDDLTLIGVWRSWNTMAQDRAVIAKGTSSGGRGWFLGQTNGALSIRSILNDAVTNVTRSTNFFAAGQVVTASEVLARATQTSDVRMSGASIGTGDTTPLVDINTTWAVRVGVYAGGTNYPLDGELQSAMIFRRALTANEIATLTAFYESPGAVFNAAIPFNSPYVTFNG